MAEQHEERRRTFSNAALAEATATAERVRTALHGRATVRGVTIDGPTSRDLDDALWLESHPYGGYTLNVSIADVGALITPEMTPALDAEALQRAFTRYHADRNVPMLPGLLSEGSLSLLAERPRPTITISIPFDPQLSPGEPAIQQTALISSRRFHYDEVDEEIADPRTDAGPMLQDTLRVALALFQRRRLQGALAIYDLRAGWATTEEGMLVRLPASNGNKAHLIIQECMILANQVLADFLAQRGIPALYRNHAAKAIAPARGVLLQMMETVVAHPEHTHPESVQETVQFALERARYAPTVEGHFGLQLPAYLHMTSPLRRYPDLVNQRILHAILKGTALPYTVPELEAMAEQVNTVEQLIKDAKKAFFLNEYDEPLRRALAEAVQSQGDAPRPLSHLDEKHFHSLIRMAAQGADLSPVIEQELYSRLEEQALNTHDIFTLVFRFQNTGEAWERVKRAALYWLQSQPHHAITLLMMGQQALGWQEATCEETAEGPGHQRVFYAWAAVTVEERRHISSWHAAPNKDLAKQEAWAEVLAHVAGVDLPAAPAEEQDDTAEATEHASQAAPLPLVPTGAPSWEGADKNAVSILHEMAQRHEIHPASYTYTLAGPPHDPLFTCTCTVTTHDGRTTALSASGKTKKAAAQEAAFQVVCALFPSDHEET
ncbi:MAG: RNB domain-containing ribonuclease [Ktedonobacteraceae bacterium]